MKRVLFITKFMPTGRSFGGMSRTLRMIDGLRERFDVRVVGYVEDGRPAIRSQASSLVRALVHRQAYQVTRYDTPALRSLVADELEHFRPDAIHVEYLQLAPFAAGIDLPRALDLHNVESALAAGIAQTSRGPTKAVAAWDARMLRSLEVQAARTFDLVTVPSAKEAERMPGGAHVLANGVDPGLEPDGATVDPHLLTFVGIFSWSPNVDGATWLVREVLPLLPNDFRVQLVGRNPNRAVRALAGDRVTVTGEVPDTWPYVSRSAVVLAPLLAPGGTRFKILEGLLAGRPVVATPAAADGLEDLVGDGLVLAEGPAAFARAVVDLAMAPVRAAELGSKGRAAVLARYDWRHTIDRLHDLYEHNLGLT